MPRCPPSVAFADHQDGEAAEPIPLAPLPARIRGRLPRLRAPLTPLLGREAEIARITALVRDPAVRLITLTGPGGVGKTRLALQVAATAADEFADGVALVELASIRDPALVAPTIAQVLGVRLLAHVAAIDALKSALRDQQVLLLLDNFEQVIEAGPQVTELLQDCPHLTVLVTSRSLLRLAGERRFVAPPLGLPDPGGTASAQRIARSAAVRLFVERARAVNPDFAMADADAPAIATIVRRLDGLPLAIELAAGWSALLTPTDLVARLDNGRHILTGGARDAPVRQQTMRNAIAWSYDLLDPAEQTLFRRLAVFTGGFTLEAAEWVMGDGSWVMGEHDIPSPITYHPLPTVLELLASLVAKSLIQRVEKEHAIARLAMLETIREYATDQLAASGEEEVLRRRHAAYFLDLAERHDQADLTPDSERLLAQLELDRANFAAALTWLESTGDAERGLRLATALGSFWGPQGHYQEGRRGLERALARGDAVRNKTKAMALIRLGYILLYQGANDDAARRLQEGLALSRELDEPFLAAQALIALGGLAVEQGENDRATAFFSTALTASAAMTDQRLAGIMAGRAFANLGVAARMRGDFEQATELHEKALQRERESRHPLGVMACLADLGYVARDQGDYEQALARYRETLAVEGGGNLLTRTVNEVLEGIATVAAATGQSERAARLIGAVDGLRERIGLGLRFPADVLAYQRAVAASRAALGEQAFMTARTAGRNLPRNQIVEEALAIDVPREQTVPSGGSTLTARERDVLRLLVAGHTDREISELLFIGRRTAEGHTRRIFEKLGVRTRAAAVARALAEGLVDPPPPSATPPDEQ